MSILDTQVSWFHDYSSTSPGGTVSLLQWLRSQKLQKKVEAIRALATKMDRDAAKSKLPCITPSGIFSKRNSSSLQKHSGIICIDIDYTGNEDIENYKALKKQLCNIVHVAYCGASVSGTGFFLLIPIAYPEKHKDHFTALKQQFWQFGIVIDKNCSNIDRLRGASFDPDAYYNHNPVTFIGLPDERQTAKQQLYQTTPGMIDGTVFERAKHYTEIVHHNKFEPGNRHRYIFRLAEYLAANRVDQWQASEWIYKNVLPQDEIKSNCISYPYQRQRAADPQSPGEKCYNSDTLKKDDPQPPVHDEPVIGLHGYPASSDEPPTGVNMAEIVARFAHTATFAPDDTNTPTDTETGSNSPTDAANEAFSLQWLVSEAQKGFKRSTVDDEKDYYPAFIHSYRPILRRLNINETELRDALNL